MSKEENNKSKKDIEIVSDDGSSLDISPVYESINTIKPKSQGGKPKNVIIPKEKK